MNTTKMDKLRDFMTWYLCYEQGLRKPRYPVPAIRQHFEFGWSLNAQQPVLMHCVQGPYEDNT